LGPTSHIRLSENAGINSSNYVTRRFNASSAGLKKSVVRGMKPVPFGKDTLLQLAVVSLAPVAPLVLTMIPMGELIDRFLHVVF